MIRRVVIPTEAYPLAWPDGVERTRHPRPSSFGNNRKPNLGLTYSSAMEEVRVELQRMRCRNIVISTNLPLRLDGQPSGSGSVRGPDHGAAVYWAELVHGSLTPHVMTCDRWSHLAHNLHSIALSIAAIRGLDRWGAVRREQAFAGFRELPAGDGSAADSTPVARPWREVLGGTWPSLPASDTLVIAKARYRRQIADYHPDRGGDAAIAAVLNQAMAEAEAELGV